MIQEMYIFYFAIVSFYKGLSKFEESLIVDFKNNSRSRISEFPQVLIKNWQLTCCQKILGSPS